ATPGKANSQAISAGPSMAQLAIDPKVLLPGNSGSGRDFTVISYQLDQPGQFANVTIYDQNGRIVKNIAEGALLSTTGFFRWDGTTNEGGLARLGYHVVIFEMFDQIGNTEVMRETLVVGRDF
ncbi:MAG: FlgD immunoglobulin-like domain containing protein, partial [Bacteroidota bacterium]